MLTGLVVGKFCPLHLGHERLIEFARAHCDRLVILSYTNPELGYPTGLRVRWLEARFPDAVRLVLDDEVLAEFAARTGAAPRRLPPNDAPDAVQRDFSAWACHTMLGLVIDRVFTSESYGDGFAAALTRYFCDHAGTTHIVEHWPYDPDRRLTPVSGSAIRDDPPGAQAFLSDDVRSSLVGRVGLVGGESSGKTVLARALAERFGTLWVPEYGRELWEQRDGDLVLSDMLAIATEQIAREDAATRAAGQWLFCDTTPLVTAFYSDAMFGETDPRVAVMAQRRYDHLLLCAPDFAFVQDGTRRDAEFRMRQHDWYRERLAEAGRPYALLTGSVEQRCDQVVRLLGGK